LLFRSCRRAVRHDARMIGIDADGCFGRDRRDDKVL
jgi:hypothetical protein